MMSLSEGWILFQIVVDLVLIAMLVHLFYLRKGIWKSKDEEWDKVTRLIEGYLAESDLAAQRLYDGLSQKTQELKEVLGALESRQEDLKISIKGADEAINGLRNSKLKAGSWEIPEGYDQVLRLSKEGLSPEEISGRTGVSQGEIDLILQLKG